MKTTGVHVIVKNKVGQVLLTQRRDVPIWVIPGGHVETGEKPEEAAIREFLEETGYQIMITHLVAKYKSIKTNNYKLLFEGQILKKNGEVDSAEVRDINWFKITNLPIPMTLYEIEKLNDSNSFSGKVIEKIDFVNKKIELINQIKHPLTFIKLIAYFLYNSTLGTKSFKLNN